MNPGGFMFYRKISIVKKIVAWTVVEMIRKGVRRSKMTSIDVDLSWKL